MIQREELDWKDRRILRALLHRTLRPSEVFWIIKDEEEEVYTRTKRRNLVDRLERLERFGEIDSLWRDKERLWKRADLPSDIEMHYDLPSSEEESRCDTNKWTYPDKKIAEREMRRIRVAMRAEGIRKLPSRAYECPWCGFWHLTSQTEER